jgi:hypothetical protein
MQFERGGFGHAVRQATRRARPELIAPAKPALDPCGRPVHVVL